MNSQPSQANRRGICGWRARIGYVCPPRCAEIFPYEFYKLVPAGVTLVITTLAVTGPSRRDVDEAFEMSMRAARELAAAGVDIVFLGGVAVNLSRGHDGARDVLRTLAVELGIEVSSSAAAQERAAKTLGCTDVVVAHPYGRHEDARLAADAERYGCKVHGVMGCGRVMTEFGASARGRDRAPRSPGWREAIDVLEREFAVDAMAASQACIWDALRRTGVNDRIEGYGRLLREF
jgi:maleate isomerase